MIVSGDGSQTVEEVLVEDNNNNNNKSKSQKVNNVFVILPRSFIK